MTLYDYEYMPEEDKIRWLDSFKILSGLRYFGGKATIGKYLANHIMNMAVKMKQDGKRADIFIDAFAGGGKIALSMPTGWFDMIVLNDYNYGVYNFFNCCKEKPEALVKMIEVLGEGMSENFFRFCAYFRSYNGRPTEQAEECEDETNISEEKKAEREKAQRISQVHELLNDTRIEPLVSAAMTYWVTQVSFNGTTDPEKVSYRLGMKDSKSGVPTKANEKEDIQKIIKHAQKHIKLVHDRMLALNIVVENLDYEQLIKKYNGKEYEDAKKNRHNSEALDEKNKLWYFDPPYHPATLFAGQEAPYEDTFTIEKSRKMVEILHGDDLEGYGEIPYFIKSDYSPKDTYKQFKEQLDIAKEILEREKKKNPASEKISQYESYIERMEKQVKTSEASYHDFDVLEENLDWEGHKGNVIDPEFYVLFVGEFDKGAVDEESGGKLKGREFIWCRGNYMSDMNKNMK